MSNLQTLLQKFEQQFGIHVRLEIIPDSSLRWSSLVEAALYRSGPDISEVGTTWVSDLVRMDALRPFQPNEVNEITRGAHYFEVVWQSSIRINHGIKTVYSIPWTSDARVIFYQRDVLEKAGIDEAMAFASFAQLEKTLEILKEKDVLEPLALSIRRSPMAIHCIASWIWGTSGDFLTPDGTNLAFDQPQALEGCKAYYRLIRFFGSDMRVLGADERKDLFSIGKVAVILSGFWEPTYDLAAEVSRNLGAKPLPGIPFVGGGNIGVWKHSRHESAALELVHFFIPSKQPNFWIHGSACLLVRMAGPTRHLIRIYIRFSELPYRKGAVFLLLSYGDWRRSA